MDPYGETPQQRESSLRLATAMELIKGHMPKRKPRVRPVTGDEMWRDVSTSKSQRVAQFAREHQPSRPAKVGLAILALAGLLAGVLWRHKHR